MGEGRAIMWTCRLSPFLLVNDGTVVGLCRELVHSKTAANEGWATVARELTRALKI